MAFTFDCSERRHRPPKRIARRHRVDVGKLLANSPGVRLRRDVPAAGLVSVTGACSFGHAPSRLQKPSRGGCIPVAIVYVAACSPFEKDSPTRAAAMAFRSLGRRKRTSASTRTRRQLFEQLEKRELLAANLADISGSPNADWAEVFQLNLSNSSGQPATWTIDWGDGSSNQHAGDATSAQHIYYDTTQTGSTIRSYLYESNGDFIGFPAEKVSVGFDGTLFAISDQDGLHRLDGHTWTDLGVSFKDISVRDSNEIWGVSPTGSVFTYDGTSLTPFGSRLLDKVSVAVDGTVWGIDQAGVVVEKSGAGWINRTASGSGTVKVAAVPGGGAWIINNLNQVHWTAPGTGWNFNGAQLTDISVGNDGSVFGVSGSQVYYWNSFQGWSWKAQSWANLTSLSVYNASNIWGIDDHGAVVLWNSTDLITLASDVHEISISPIDSVVAEEAPSAFSSDITLQDVVSSPAPTAVRIGLTNTATGSTVSTSELPWEASIGDSFLVKPIDGNPSQIEVLHDDIALAMFDFGASQVGELALIVSYLSGDTQSGYSTVRSDEYAYDASQPGILAINPQESSDLGIRPLRSELDKLELAADAVDPAGHAALIPHAIATTLGYVALDYFQRFNQKTNGVISDSRWRSRSSVFVTSTNQVELHEGGEFYFIPKGLELQLPETIDIDWEGVLNDSMKLALQGIPGQAVAEVLRSVTGVQPVSSSELLLAAESQGKPIAEWMKLPDGNFLNTMTGQSVASIANAMHQSVEVESYIESAVNDGFTVRVNTHSATLTEPTSADSWLGVGMQLYRKKTAGIQLRTRLYRDTVTGPTIGGKALAVATNSNVQLTVPGTVHYEELDVSLPSIGLNSEIKRFYKSGSTRDVGFGAGWSFTYGDYLLTVAGDASLTWVAADGTERSFTQQSVDGNGVIHFTSQDDRGVIATKHFEGSQPVYSVIHKDQTKLSFHPQPDYSARLHTIEDRNGNRHYISYLNDQIAFVRDDTDLSNLRTRFTFSYVGSQISSITDDVGRTWSYSYQSVGTSGPVLTTVTGPGATPSEQRISTYSYDTGLGTARLQTAVDGVGNEASYFYAPNGRLRWHRNALGDLRLYRYDDHGRVTIGSDERGFVAKKTFDSLGRVISNELANGGGESFGYVGNESLLAFQSSADGTTTTYQYDSSGNVTQTSTNDLVTMTTYDPTFNQVISVTESNASLTGSGRVIAQNTIDASGNVISSVNANGETIQRSYSSRGLVLTEVSARGHQAANPADFTTTITYNEFGQVLTRSRTVAGTAAAETFVYGSDRQLYQQTNPEGVTTTYEYDSYGQLVKVERPDPYAGTADAVGPIVTSMILDQQGRIIQQTNPDQTVIQYSYDAAGRPLSKTTDGRLQEFEYDASGNVILTRDVAGDETRYFYDAAGNNIETQNSDGTKSIIHYDLVGKASNRRDAAFQSTQFLYSQIDKSVEILAPTGHVTRQHFDVFGNLISETIGDAGSSLLELGSPSYYDVSQRGYHSGINQPTHYAQPFQNSDNVALHAVVTVSNQDSGSFHNPSYLTGGMYGNGNSFKSNDPQVEITLDLGTSEWIDSIAFGRDRVGELVDSQIKRFTISASEDGTLFHELMNSDDRIAELSLGNLGANHHISAGFRTTKARYVRLDVEVVDGGGAVVIDEIEVNRASASKAPALQHTYDNANRLIQSERQGQWIAQSDFDADGNTTETRRYDIAGLTTIPQDLGTLPSDRIRISTVQYDAAGRPTQWTNADGGIRTAEYNFAGQLVASVDELGLRQEMSYDGAGNVYETRITDGVNFANDQVVKSIVDPTSGTVENHYGTGLVPVFSRTTELEFDASTLSTNFTGLVGQSSQTIHSSDGRTSTTTDASGRIITTIKDSAGRVLGSTLNAGPNSGLLSDRTSTYQYDFAGRLSSWTDPLGNISEVVYDVIDKKVTRVSPELTSGDPNSRLETEEQFDDAGRVISRTNADGHTTNYSYDLLGRLISTTLPDPDGAGPLPAPVITNTYNGFGEITSQTDQLGRTTSFTYDVMGRLLTVTTPDPDSTGPLTSTTTTRTYDHGGNVTSVDDGLGRLATWQFDERGRVTVETLPDPDPTDANPAPSISYTYNVEGQVSQIVDVMGNATNFEYDDLGRQTKRVLAEAFAGEVRPEIVTTYDSAGNVATITDTLGNTTAFEYNDAGELTKVISPDPDGAGALPSPVREYEYDAAGRISKFIGESGSVIDYEYDAIGRLAKQVLSDPDGTGPLADFETTWTYDAAGNVLSITDSLNRVTSFTYDALGRELTQTHPDPDPATTNDIPVFTKTYDAAGNLASVTDALGRTTTLEYDDAGRLIKQTRPAVQGVSPVTDFKYDQAGNLASVVDPLGRETVYEYDAWGRVVKTTLPDADLSDSLPALTLVQAYDAASRVILDTDTAGRSTEYVYDGRGQLIETHYPDLDPLDGLPAPKIVTEYDSAGRVTATIDTLGAKTEYQYDNLGRATHVILPTPDGASGNGPTSVTVYDASGNVLQQIDPLGRTTSYAHDEWGRETLRTLPDPDGSGALVSPTIQTVYSSAGNIWKTIDHLGRETVTLYDDLDRAISTTYPDPNPADTVAAPVIQTEFDVTGAVVKQIDEMGRITQYSYDELGRLIQTTLPDPDLSDSVPPPVETQVYDLVGNVVSSTDADGDTATWIYDRLDRTISEQQADPDGPGPELAPLTIFSYDSAGNVATEERLIAAGVYLVTSFAYDTWNRQTSVTAPEGDVTSYSFDTEGNLLTVSDASGNTTTFTYDRLSRQLTSTNQLGDTRSYTYDDAGRLTQRTDRNGRVTEYVHDDLDRVTSEKWLNAGVKVEEYISTYNSAGLLATIGDGDVNDVFTYDDADQLTQAARTGAGLTPFATFTYSYNVAGQIESVIQAIPGNDNVTTNYYFDDAGRIEEIEQTGVSITTKSVEYDLSDSGQVVGLHRFSGSSLTPAVSTTVTRDSLGRRTQIRHHEGTQTLAQYTYSYDAASRVVAVDSLSDGLTTLTLDDNGRLTGADHTSIADESFQYDSTGNRVGPANTIGSNNQLLSDGDFNYEYDAEGNRTARVEIATGDRTEYTYDHRNRLTFIERFNSSGALLERLEYSYDSTNQRVGRAHDSDGDGYADFVERFVVDGAFVTAVLDEVGDVRNQFFHGSGVDEILADEDSSGDVTWTLADGNKTIRDLAQDVAGATQVVNHRVFDSFGTLVSQTNPSIDHLFGFTGRDHDEATGLHYYRDRWMDPLSGLFLSEDPIGFDGGDVNLSNYVGGAPYDYTDPTGNSWLSDAFKKIGREINRVIDQVAGVIDEAIDDIGDFLEEAWDDTREFVQDHPWISAAAALATGTWFITAAGGFAGAVAKIGALATKAVGSVSTSWAPASSGIGGTASLNIGSFASVNVGAGISGTSAFASANVSILGLPVVGAGKSVGALGKISDPFASTLVGNFSDSLLSNSLGSFGEFSLPTDIRGSSWQSASLFTGNSINPLDVASFLPAVAKDTAFSFGYGQLARTGIPTVRNASRNLVSTINGIGDAFDEVFSTHTDSRLTPFHGDPGLQALPNQLSTESSIRLAGGPAGGGVAPAYHEICLGRGESCIGSWPERTKGPWDGNMFYDLESMAIDFGDQVEFLEPLGNGAIWWGNMWGGVYESAGEWTGTSWGAGAGALAGNLSRTAGNISGGILSPSYALEGIADDLNDAGFVYDRDGDPLLALGEVNHLNSVAEWWYGYDIVEDRALSNAEISAKGTEAIFAISGNLSSLAGVATKLIRPGALFRHLENVSAHQRFDLPTVQCFAPRTAVHTPNGLRPIGEITRGDRVFAFNFDEGSWEERRVLCRHDSFFEGDVVEVRTSSDAIEVTSGHPFWVVSGEDLANRPVCFALKDKENEGKSLEGRWVHSDDLRVGDFIQTKCGTLAQVESIEIRPESKFPVCNLSVEDLSNYAVGDAGMLVHNTPVCELDRLAQDGVFTRIDVQDNRIYALISSSEHASDATLFNSVGTKRRWMRMNPDDNTAARRRGINRAISAERELVRSGHPGTADSGWTWAERRMIAETGEFPSDVNWHHINDVERNIGLADNPDNLLPSRGGFSGHVQKYHPNGTRAGSQGDLLNRANLLYEHLRGL